MTSTIFGLSPAPSAPREEAVVAAWDKAVEAAREKAIGAAWEEAVAAASPTSPAIELSVFVFRIFIGNHFARMKFIRFQVSHFLFEIVQL
jgi:hypothetical protein